MALSNFHLHTVSSKEEAALQLTQSLNSLLSQLHTENKPFLLLLSGGSAFDLLAHLNLENFNDSTTIGMLDERYSTDPKENNYAQVKQSAFYTAAKEKRVHEIDTTVSDNETGEQHAKRFADALSTWKKDHSDGEIVAIVGIGPDGHTSGILPFPENPSLFTKLFENPDVLVVDYDADGKNPYRYRSTTTNTFLRDYIDYSFVYAVGENKKDALSRLVSETGNLPETPARVLREMKDVQLFTDVSLE